MAKKTENKWDAMKDKAAWDMLEMLSASMLAGFETIVKDLHRDGSATRWRTEKRLKAQERELNRLDRETKAVKKMLKELREMKGKKPA
jgi:hypothetical protein